MQPLISLVMIVKNEEEILEKCLNSVKDIIDEFIIVDTGSTDNTKDIIKKYGKLYEIPFENYVKTKNEALKLASGEYILWMDADEVLYQGVDILRIHAEEKNYDAISAQITEGSFEDYSNVFCQYDRFRLWKNGFEFVGPRVHEVVSISGKTTRDLRILVRHEHIKKDKAETAHNRFTNYVRLLKEAINNNEDVVRAWFYLGRTYKDLNQHLNAISAYLEYLSQPNISFKDEIWQTHYDLAACYKINGEYNKAIEWLNKSKLIDDRRSETDCLLGDIYFQQQDYKLAEFSYKQAIREIPKDVTLFLNPYFYGKYPKDQLMLCYYYLKQFDQSFNINKELIEEIKGRDNRILNNHFWILRNKKQNIFLTLGVTPEEIYGGLIDKQGVGGVETTYLELSKELANSGMNVFLFGFIKEPHIYENVYYIPYQDINDYWGLKPDVIISSRWFEPFYHEDYSKKIIWYQDAFFGLPNDYQEIFKKTSLIVCSSLWHKHYILERLCRLISKENLKIIPLGIRKNLFKKNIERNLNQVVYSSNPDRGLESLIDMWPTICESITNINLIVTYGWEGLTTWSTDSSWYQSINRLKTKCFNQAEKFGNIKFTGRLNKNDLAEVMLSSSILVYPNNFWETFCLTALEAQAAGLPIITTDIGALSTVVNREFNILLQGSPDSSKYQKDFIENLCEIINNKEDLNRRSLGNLKYIESINCDWEDINKMWIKLLYELKE
jgi:glycosyltransferase involved in cell wall biosynthesis/lipopolysaccharide biosynthesis regulator YciM